MVSKRKVAEDIQHLTILPKQEDMDYFILFFFGQTSKEK